MSTEQQQKIADYGVQVVIQEKERIESSTQNEAAKEVARETASKLIEEIRRKADK